MQSTRLRLHSRRGASTADCRNDHGAVRTEHQLRLREKCFRCVSVQTGTDICWAHARHDPICPMNSSASVKQTEASLQRKCGKTKKMTENYGGVGAGERWDPFQVRDSVRPKGPGSLIAANDRLKGPSCCCISAHCALAARRRGVRVRLCSCRGRRLGYRQLCVWWL